MPIYVYRCNKCGRTFEKLCNSFKDRPSSIVCSVCGGIATPIISPTAIHFKRDGFYETDYKEEKKLREKNEELRRKK